MKSHPILSYLQFFSLLLGSSASFSQDNPQLTNDGLHLKGEGYLLWLDII